MKPFDENGTFRPVVTANETGKLRTLAVRGAAVTLLSGCGVVFLQIISAVFLARLLAPRDFGIVAMVTTFSQLLMNFGGNGFNEAVIQRERIDHRLISNLFWINVGAASLLTVAFACAGKLLAWFFHDELLTHVTVGMSLTIVLTSFSVLHLALLRRAMRFTAVSVNDIASRIACVAVSIAMAWGGWGYWALVGGAVAQALVLSIGALLTCRWIPGLPSRVAGTGEMVRFAMHTYTRFTMNYVGRNTDNVLVGWRFSAQSLGFYKKAYDLFGLAAGQFVGALTSVAISGLSRLNQDTKKYKEALIGIFAVLGFVSMGLAADLTLGGKDLIRLLLGPGWDETAKIFAFFGPGIGAMMVYYAHGWIHLSIGRADRWLKWGILELGITCLLFFAGLPWGPIGIAVAWTVSFWILMLPSIWYAGRPIQLRIGSIIAVLWRSAVAALLAGIATSLLSKQVPTLLAAPGAGWAAIRLVLITLVFLILYVLSTFVLHGGYGPVASVLSLSRQILPGSRAPSLDTTHVDADGALVSE